jgi:nitrate/nitrite transporter NarK
MMSDVERRPVWPAILRIILFTIVLSVCLGFFTAFFENDSHSTRGWLFGGLFALITAGALFQIFRDGRQLWRDFALMPSRERTSSRMMLGMLAAGGALGAVTVLSSDLGGQGALPGIGSMNSVVAILLAAFILVIGPWASRRWWQATDEHEQRAYAEGAHVAASAALYAGLCWWLLSRAALVPPPDGMAIVLGISVIWSAVWLYRKYS